MELSIHTSLPQIKQQFKTGEDFLARFEQSPNEIYSFADLATLHNEKFFSNSKD